MLSNSLLVIAFKSIGYRPSDTFWRISLTTSIFTGGSLESDFTFSLTDKSTLTDAVVAAVALSAAEVSMSLLVIRATFFGLEQLQTQHLGYFLLYQPF
ncbi:MAG: hypothetical protein CM15mP85_04950 [Rhodobacterales bacterium]|nr:MAG: hypothetical protein CM15mP85_04950 [Rhodobacterales bacterium]